MTTTKAANDEKPTKPLDIIQATPAAAIIILRYQKELTELTANNSIPKNISRYNEAINDLLSLMKDVVVVTGFGENVSCEA